MIEIKKYKIECGCCGFAEIVEFERDSGASSPAEPAGWTRQNIAMGWGHLTPLFCQRCVADSKDRDKNVIQVVLYYAKFDNAHRNVPNYLKEFKGALSYAFKAAEIDAAVSKLTSIGAFPMGTEKAVLLPQVTEEFKRRGLGL